MSIYNRNNLIIANVCAEYEPRLKGVRVQKGATTATDGYILIKVDNPLEMSEVGQKTEGVVPKETALRMLNDMGNANYCSITIAGKEPITFPHVNRMIERMLKEKVSTQRFSIKKLKQVIDTLAKMDIKDVDVSMGDKSMIIEAGTLDKQDVTAIIMGIFRQDED